MVFETTYENKETKELISNLVGSPFSFFKAIRLGGVGSKRMIISKASPNMQQYLNKVADISYANIELRPNGLLILINKGLKNFTWAIPYYHCYLYTTEGASIHAQGRFLHFKDNRTLSENRAFFEKLSLQKVAYELTHPHIDSI